MPGHVRWTHLFVRPVGGAILGALEVPLERRVIVLRDLAGDPLARPPTTDGAGNRADDEADWPADSADRRSGRTAKKSE